MPKHASMSQVENHAQSEVELDPIVWGLLDKVPPNGEPWPKSARTAWLNLLSLTLDLLYPDQQEKAPGTAPHAATQHP